MADFSIMGFIDGIFYKENVVIVTMSENSLGYVKKDGTVVENGTSSWRIAFKQYFKKYISTHFAPRMYVKVKGIVIPYIKDRNGNVKEGYTVIGQTIDLAPYPKEFARKEHSLTKDPSFDVMGEPDIEGFEQADF